MRQAENGKRPKLSKRYDRVAIEDYRAHGFLPDVVNKYLAGLDQEAADDDPFDLLSFAADLDLGMIGSNAVVFDEAKLRHLNGVHLRNLSASEYHRTLVAFADDVDLTGLTELVEATHTRVETLGEAVRMLAFATGDELVIDEASWAAVHANRLMSKAILAAALQVYPAVSWTPEGVRSATEQIAAMHGLKLGKAQLPIRVAVTGNRVGAPLFESLTAVSRELALGRLHRAHARL